MQTTERIEEKSLASGTPSHSDAGNPFRLVRSRYILLWVLVVGRILFDWAAERSPSVYQDWLPVFMYVIAALVLLLLLRGKGIRWELVFGTVKRRNDWLLAPYVALVSNIVAYTIVVLVCRLVILCGQVVPDSSPSEASPLSIGIPVYALLPGVVEELICRGVLLHRLATKWRVGTGILLCSLAFAIGHGDLVEILCAFIPSLMYCLVYIRTGSLLVVMLAHVLDNVLALMLDTPVMLPYCAADQYRHEWIAVAGSLVSLTAVIAFVIRHWPKGWWELPYFANAQAQAGPAGQLQPDPS